VHEQAGTREIPLLKGLKVTMPRTAALLVLGSGAAMGMPPFASFLAELMVIAAGISAYSITALTILVPVITSGYFLWMIKRSILSLPEGNSKAQSDIPKPDALAISVYFVPLVILIVFSFLIVAPAVNVAQWLINLNSGGG